MDPQYREQVSNWLAFAETKKIRKSEAWTYFNRLMMALGFKFPPTIFWKFHWCALALGFYFTVTWGLLMQLTVWRNEPPMQVAITSLGAGAMFGLSMAAYFKYRRQKLGLRSWESFRSTTSR